MSAYITRADLLNEIPEEKLAQALDDDGDHLEDAGRADAICLAASEQVDGYLTGQYTVAAATIKRAALVFAMEVVYRRRAKFGDANPFTDEAIATRKKLESVQRGEVPGTGPASTPGAVVSETARTVGAYRL